VLVAASWSDRARIPAVGVRTLRAWRALAIAVNRPGFYEAQEMVLAGTGTGMLLEDAVRLYRRDT
jgi:hypothetical protein